MPTLDIQSGQFTLKADLYGKLPSKRAVVLVHGSSWDALGWRDVAPRFVERGVPALALNLRGFDGSAGKTGRYVAGKPWSPVTDVKAAVALLRERGVPEVALVGASLGGSAVLGAALEEDVECVSTISAPVKAVPDEMSAHVRGRKLYVCAIGDTLGAAPNVLASFKALRPPKQLLFFGGKEHSRGMLAAPYGPEVVDAIVAFVARGLAA
ncbi:MAG: alpha/beta hydrolase [Candidatus Limnocylindria bacterium]